MEHAGDAVSKHRMEALSDGLYAIALTLLVLDLKVPVLPDGASNAALLEALRDVAPRAFSWLLSFWVMGILWTGQVRTYRYVHTLSWAIVRADLLILGLVSLMPFSTALFSEYGSLPVAAVVYSTNLLAIAVLGALRTHVLVGDERLHAVTVDALARRNLLMRSAIFLGSSAATLVLAFFIPPWNMLAMLPTLLRPGFEHRS